MVKKVEGILSRRWQQEVDDERQRKEEGRGKRQMDHAVVRVDSPLHDVFIYL